MSRLWATVIAAVMAALAIAAPSASATHTNNALSDEAGWPCTATSSRAAWTLLASPQAGWVYSPLVKQPRAVITSWNVRVGPGLVSLPQQLGVFRQVNGGVDYTKVAESAIETFGPGAEAVPTRIPVQGGDFVGLHGPFGTFVCDVEEGSSSLYEGPLGLGETRTFKAEGGVRSPVSATAEIDMDGDGYGDASQDHCPESALFQTACPLVALDIGDVEVKRAAILIEVGVSSTASVEARGWICWIPRPKTGRATPSTRPCRGRVGLRTRSAITIEAGTPATLRVPLPRAVQHRLDRLSPRGSQRVWLNLVATNPVPYTDKHRLSVKLPGRAMPQRPR